MEIPVLLPPLRGHPGMPIVNAEQCADFSCMRKEKLIGDAQKEDLRARNRIAASKWRAKRDECLYELEAENDDLRKKALQLRTEITSLKTENEVLEKELTFFQLFMAKLMEPQTSRA